MALLDVQLQSLMELLMLKSSVIRPLKTGVNVHQLVRVDTISIRPQGVNTKRES